MARISLENEKYFCDLDGEMGDADFGKSIRDGFSAVLNELAWWAKALKTARDADHPNGS